MGDKTQTTYERIMTTRLFDSLVWGSLRLAPTRQTLEHLETDRWWIKCVAARWELVVLCASLFSLCSQSFTLRSTHSLKSASLPSAVFEATLESGLPLVSTFSCYSVSHSLESGVPPLSTLSWYSVCHPLESGLPLLPLQSQQPLFRAGQYSFGGIGPVAAVWSQLPACLSVLLIGFSIDSASWTIEWMPNGLLCL